MTAIQLTPAHRKEKRGEAHHLDPVVMIGAEGLTPAVIKETDAALKAHGLIKVRVLSDDRASREAMLAQLAEKLDAAPVQHIGKTLVIWRENPELVKARAKALLPPQKKKAPRRTRQQEENIAAGKTRRRPR